MPSEFNFEPKDTQNSSKITFNPNNFKFNLNKSPKLPLRIKTPRRRISFNNNPNVKLFNNGSKKSLSAYNKLKQNSNILKMEKQENNATRFLSKRGQQLKKFTSKNMPKGYNLAKYNLTRKVKKLKGENRNFLKAWSRGNVNASVNEIAGVFKNSLTNDEKEVLRVTRENMKSRPTPTRKKMGKDVLGVFAAVGAL